MNQATLRPVAALRRSARIFSEIQNPSARARLQTQNPWRDGSKSLALSGNSSSIEEPLASQPAGLPQGPRVQKVELHRKQRHGQRSRGSNGLLLPAPILHIPIRCQL